jgi:hypothetical protein
MEKKPFMPLGKVLNIIQPTSLEVTYNYDDLVFVEHNPFIIRFDLKDSKLIHLHFNKDCEAKEAEKLTSIMKIAALNEEMNLHLDKKFVIEAKEETEELEIRFN